jgi:uncharacterized membrane protein
MIEMELAEEERKSREAAHKRIEGMLEDLIDEWGTAVVLAALSVAVAAHEERVATIRNGSDDQAT